MNAAQSQGVDVLTASQWLETNQALLVDVREPAEHAGLHIPGAHLLPLSRIKQTPAPEHADRKLIVHCKAGGRSKQACQTWAETSSGPIYWLEGGIEAWQQAGLPTQKSISAPRLDVQRQLQLVIGLGGLIGLTLGLLVSPWFFTIAFIFAGGLTMAGITGLCPLAMIIARMPWNQRGQASAMPLPPAVDQPINECLSKACALPSSKR